MRNEGDKKKNPRSSTKRVFALEKNGWQRKMIFFPLWGGSQNRDTLKWMVKIMEIPLKMDDLGVPPFSETPFGAIWAYFQGRLLKTVSFREGTVDRNKGRFVNLAKLRIVRGSLVCHAVGRFFPSSTPLLTPLLVSMPLRLAD